MPQRYDEEFRKKMIRLHVQEGRTYKSLVAEYGVSKASISKWCREFSKECHKNEEGEKTLADINDIISHQFFPLIFGVQFREM